MDPDLRRGVLLVCLSVGLTAVSYGAVAVASGFPVWLPAVTATLVLAGSSEFLFVGIVAGGGNPFAAVAAGLLVNARHVPYGLALPDVLGRGWRRAVGTHVMNDESVVLALAQPDRDRQRAAYWISGLGILVSWPLGALLGSVGAAFVHDTSKLGLDAMFPAVILALVLPALREKVTLAAGLVGAAVALVGVPFAPSGLPELLALAGVLVVVAKRPGQAGAEPEAETETETETHPAANPIPMPASSTPDSTLPRTSQESAIR
jgi:4-azaleucine resistance transporter AzlC